MADIYFDKILTEIRESSNVIPSCIPVCIFDYYTWNEMVTLSNNAQFKKGSFYYIVDRFILIQAITESFLALNGIFYDNIFNEADYIEYDLLNDFISRRKDKRGNDVSLSRNYLISQGLPLNSITFFDFGNDNVYGNTIVNSYVSNIGFAGTFSKNVILNQSVIDLVSVDTNINDFSDNFIDSTQFVVPHQQATTFSVTKNNFSRVSFSAQGEQGCTLLSNQFVDSFVSWEKWVNPNLSYNRLTSYGQITLNDGTSVTNRNITITKCLITTQGSLTITISSGSATCQDIIVDTKSVLGNAESPANWNDFNVTNDSFVLYQSSPMNSNKIFVTDKSTLNVKNRIFGNFNNIVVKDFSTINIDAGGNLINNWYIDEHSSVILNSNSTNKQNIFISKWSVQLDPADAHNNIKLWVSDNSSISPTYASNVIEFFDYNTKVVGNYFQLTSGTSQAYIGIIFLFNCSTNPALPSILNGFQNSNTMPVGLKFMVQPDAGQYLEVRQDLIPVTQENIGMTNTITLFGQNGQITADTLLLQAVNNSKRRFIQLGHWYYT